MVGKLKSKEIVAEGTIKVVFEIKEPFNFKPGQYCVVNINNIKHFFSINNSPNEKGVIVITTRLSGSEFKNTLKELPIGAKVEIGHIGGQFVLPDDTQTPLVLIAGGIGITPFMSILKLVSEEKLPYKITLIYSNRNQASTAYLREVQSFTQTIPDFKPILTMTEDNEWTGEKRKVDSEFVKEYFPNLNENNYFVVGPPGMVSAVKSSLLEAGVLLENIKIENFTGY